jgi:hypothetical protein
MKLIKTLILLFVLFNASINFGQVTVTPADGGLNIPRSLATNGHAAGDTLLGNIVITETLVSDIKQSQSGATLILTAPTNWQFTTTSGDVAATAGDDITAISISGNVTTTAGDDITAISISVAASAITITLTTANGGGGKNSIDEITISNIRVQPIDGNITPAAGDILRSSANAGNVVIDGITEDVTNFGSLSTDPATSMPVELTSFTADVKKNKVLLNWETETEVNNFGFEVQRSVMENDWEVIGFVEGHGNSYSPKQYEFTDDLSALANPSLIDSLNYRLKQIDLDGKYEYYELVEAVNLISITGIYDEGMPVKFELMQNYPNPFNPSTKIKFGLPESGAALLEVYNTIGEKIATLIDGELPAGHHEAEWNASGIPSGIYLYKITAGNYVDIKKMMLLK